MVTKSVEQRLVKFVHNNAHQVVHDALYESARCLFIEIVRTDEQAVLNNYTAFLELILRIRQSCCHASLIPSYRRECAQKVLDEYARMKARSREEKDNIDISLAQELLDRLHDVLGGNEVTECAICFDQLDDENAVILKKCKHVFCYACLDRVMNQLCPFCRVEYSEGDKIEIKDAKQAIDKPNERAKKAARSSEDIRIDSDGLGRSPKIQAMLNAINELGADEKCVIFSQWTSMLDIIQAEFDELEYTYCRIDGKMSADERMSAMEKFDTEGCDMPDTPRFILCSLHACGVGINLTRGNVVYMMDCWWNSAAESQVSHDVRMVVCAVSTICDRFVYDVWLPGLAAHNVIQWCGGCHIECACRCVVGRWSLC
jgi:SNF2 family DNA or RNA helicase